jgi:undecaprenyl-diphosphatase
MGIVVPSRRPVSSALLIGVPSLVIFILLALAASSGEPFAWENSALTSLHTVATPALDSAAVWWSRVFHPQVLAVATLLLTIGFVLRRAWRQAIMASGIVLGALLLSTVVKEIIERPRPRLWPTITGETNSGFPSGHAMTSCAFAALLVIIFWPTRWRGAALTIAAIWLALVALARLYLGVHYPTDILAGWGLALAWAMLVARLSRSGRGDGLA